MRSALTLISLSILALILSLALLLVLAGQQNSSGQLRQAASEYSITLDQLGVLVASDGSQWAQGDRLASLVALADVQSQSLGASNSFTRWFPAPRLGAAKQETDAKWATLREQLMSLNKASNLANTEPGDKPENSTPEIQTPDDSQEPVATTEVVSVEVVGDIQSLSESFEEIKLRVLEGTRGIEIRELVNQSSELWGSTSGLPRTSQGLIEAIAQQKSNALELLQLSGVNAQAPLFGYSTKNLILDYTGAVAALDVVTTTNRIPIPDPVVDTVDDLKSETDTPVKVQDELPELSLVTQTLGQLMRSLDGFISAVEEYTLKANRTVWIAVAGFFTSLLLAAIAAWRVLKNSRLSAAKPPSVSLQPDSLQSGPSYSKPLQIEPGQYAPPQSGETEHSRKEQQTLLSDINAVSEGDLRYPVRAPSHKHSAAVADSVNRTSTVMSNLVGMTRGVAEKIADMVARHDTLSRRIGEKDINRQSQTAELSEGVSRRSGMLGEQQKLLVSAASMTAELDACEASAQAAVNSASASLATVSAQVDVSVEKLQRLLGSTGKLNDIGRKLRKLAEQTQLQALNASLKMTETEGAIPESTQHGSEDLDRVHQLAGSLTEVSVNAEAMVGVLQKEIADAVHSLKEGRSGFDNSARQSQTASHGARDISTATDAIKKTIQQALDNIEEQKRELSISAEQIVALDKTGNEYSYLTMTLSQDIAELQAMARKLDDSVAGFKLREDAGLEQ